MKFKVGDLISLKVHYALKGTLGVLVGIPEGFGPPNHGLWFVKWLNPSTPLANTCHESNMEKVA